MIEMTPAVSFTAFYLQYFGDRRMQHIDLLPEAVGEDFKRHACLDEKFLVNPPDPKQAAEDFDKYTHPCWCNPELIFADDLKGNEVWLHKRVQ
jgi:hypothetical protein